MDGSLPPILVRADNLQVVDGMHRLAAAKLRGAGTIEARLVEGDTEESFVLAVRSNITHGRPLTLADRKAAARRIIDSHPGWSDRMVASVSGIAAATVKALREADSEHTDERLGRDGRVRPVDASSRRAVAKQILRAHPEYSLRTVAKMAGLSPETVRSVKAGLAQEPEVSGQQFSGPPADGSAQEDPGRSMRIVMSDPALRSNDLGRAFLRSLSTYSVVHRYSAAIVELIPEYNLELVCGLARAVADAWEELAKAVDQKSSPRRNCRNGTLADYGAVT